MNYQDYKKTQEKAKDKPIHQSRPDKPVKQPKPFRPDRFWNLLSELANPAQIIAVISMFIFGGLNQDLRLPEIPAFLCFITVFLFFVRSKIKDSFEWLTLIWLFNAGIWTLNYVFLT